MVPLPSYAPPTPRPVLSSRTDFPSLVLLGFVQHIDEVPRTVATALRVVVESTLRDAPVRLTVKVFDTRAP